MYCMVCLLGLSGASRDVGAFAGIMIDSQHELVALERVLWHLGRPTTWSFRWRLGRSLN